MNMFKSMGQDSNNHCMSMETFDEENPSRKNTGRTEVTKSLEMPPSVTMRFTVKATDPLSLMFVMLADRKMAFYLSLIRFAPIFIMVCLLYWIVLLSQQANSEHEYKFSSQPVFPNWFLIASVYLATYMPEIRETCYLCKEFRILWKFQSNCRSRKLMILFSGIICFLVKFLVGSMLSLALSLYIALMLTGGDLIEVLTRALVVHFLRDIDDIAVEHFIRKLCPDGILTLRISELKYPAFDEKWEAIDDVAFQYVDKRLEKKRNTEDLEENVNLRNLYCNDIDAEKILREYCFWNHSEVSKEDLFQNLQSDWAPTCQEERMRFWTLIADKQRGLGISDHGGTTCSIDVSFFDLRKVQKVGLKMKEFFPLITETDWRNLSTTQREYLFCRFPQESSRLPVGRETLDLRNHEWRTEEHVGALRTIIDKNPTLRSLKLSLTELNDSCVNIIVNTVQGRTSLSSFAVPFEELDRRLWLSLLRINNSNLAIGLIKTDDFVEMRHNLFTMNFRNKPAGCAKFMGFLNFPEDTDFFRRCRDGEQEWRPLILRFSAIEGSKNLWVQVVAHFEEKLSKNTFRCLSLLDRKNLQDEFAVPTAPTSHETLALTVKRINLGGNGLGAISQFVKDNPSLKFLDISETRITHSGLNDIVSALLDNTNLDEFRARGNNFGDEGAKSLVNLLMVSKTLRKVVFADTKMTTVGFRAILNALDDKHCLAPLEYIDVQKNFLVAPMEMNALQHKKPYLVIEMNNQRSFVDDDNKNLRWSGIALKEECRRKKQRRNTLDSLVDSHRPV
eukprot:GEMP01002072.1.p1 GENE.GEMP01002072.1~~GEMP01002072.1.p1  ORF type:complete len:788 (+),score=62.28 GEMP01002072.1:43-2406(+)